MQVEISNDSVANIIATELKKDIDGLLSTGPDPQSVEEDVQFLMGLLLVLERYSTTEDYEAFVNSMTSKYQIPS